MAYTDWTNLARSGLSSAITPAGRIGNGLPSQSHTDSADELRFIGQAQPTNLSQGQIGVIEPQQTPAGRLNSTKPTGVGESYPELNVSAPDGVNLNEQTIYSRYAAVSGSAIVGNLKVAYYQLLAYDANCNPARQTVWVSKNPDYSDAPSPPCSGSYTSPKPIILATWFV